MIEMSVVLPFWEAKYIGWLPIESLIRQKNIDFEWELIIAEEKTPLALGEQNIRKYLDYLKGVGCVRFNYIELDKWVPLGKKLMLLYDDCSKDSKIFTWTAADCYLSPLSLDTQYKAFSKNDIDMFLTEKTIYYDIKTCKTILDDKAFVNRKDDCMEKAYSMKLVGQFHRKDLERRRSGLDGTFHRQIIKLKGGRNKVNIYTDKSENWKYRFSTNGMNKITTMRKRYFTKLGDSFVKCPVNLSDTIPKEIMSRLKNPELIKKAS